MANPSTEDSRFVRWIITYERTHPELITREVVREKIQRLAKLEDEGKLELCGPFADGGGGIAILSPAWSPKRSPRANTKPVRTKNKIFWTLGPVRTITAGRSWRVNMHKS